MQEEAIGSLSPDLSAAVNGFAAWWESHLRAMDVAQKVKRPLFHYTDADGLTGIVKNQEIWFTSIFHVNDPSELVHGVEIALEILRKEGEAGDKVIRLFCEKFKTALVPQLGKRFGFYVASFSQAPDDLGQWRAYADDGRGFALGLAPHLFHSEDTHPSQPNEMVFVSEVSYSEPESQARQAEPIHRAIEIVKDCTGRIKSVPEGREFLKQMSIAVSVPIVWNSITTKHPAYAHERETRLIIVNDLEKLAPHVETRTRGSDLVPFIRSPMPIRAADSIVEIVVGPSADDGAEDAVQSFLISQGLPKQVAIRRSGVPYRSRRTK